MIERPDLDGCRLQKPGEPDVWLMLQGRRHRIANPSTYSSLFGKTDGLMIVDYIDSLKIGPDIQEGTFLARPDGSLDIYLIMRTSPDSLRRHHIPNWETFCEFEFDQTKLQDVPPALLKALPSGGDILGPLGRLARGDMPIAERHD